MNKEDKLLSEAYNRGEMELVNTSKRIFWKSKGNEAVNVTARRP